MDAKLEALAAQCGFTHWGNLDVSTLDLRQDVRDMCLANSCGQYGKRWGCPPGCGTLEECRSYISQYSSGILVQTTGILEDIFDGDTMMETERQHKAHVAEMARLLGQRYPNLLTMGTGCCTLCQTCTYPTEPCRFPWKRITSMEAYGLLVLDICKKNGMKYYYGENTIAYTSCFLLE